jgi:hypothetical protein
MYSSRSKQSENDEANRAWDKIILEDERKKIDQKQREISSSKLVPILSVFIVILFFVFVRYRKRWS